MSRSNEFTSKVLRADAASRTRSSETWGHLFPALSSGSPIARFVDPRRTRCGEVCREIDNRSAGTL